MNKYNFWKNWKNKTATEKKAIKLVKLARTLVINSIPKDKLVAIYIKGSFARREMKKDSDVDMVPIVTENKYESLVFETNVPEVYPVMIVPLSLQEFQQNKLLSKSSRKPDTRAKPDRLLKNLKEYKLIYGQPLNPKKYPIRNDKTALKDEISIIKNGYIPFYEKKKIPFDALLKEFFWLVELEQVVAGKKIKHSFNDIAKSITDKNHLIHNAFALRKNPSKSKEKEFILKLKKYLSNKRV